MISLGFVSAILGDKSLEEVLDIAAENGFKFVELMCWPVGKAERRYAGVTHIDVDALNAGRVAEIRGLCASKGVGISALGYYPNPLDEDVERREFYVRHLEKVIDAAAALGVPVVTTFIGRIPSKDLEFNFSLFEKVWPPIIRHAEEKKVRVAIENCPMYFSGDEWPSGKNLAYSPAIFRRMFKSIPSSYFGLNFDPSHFVWQQMDYLKPLKEFKDRLFHIHIKDVKVDQDKLDDVGILGTPLQYHSPRLPGMGDVDWGKFMSTLYEAGYRGPACIEVEDRNYESDPSDVVRALIQSRNYMAQFIA
ncbi:MAG: sugar phosphate isomerase/epimerase [Chlorobium sp.]|nr:sugar phosphate isomerase/epimerase [Chlorobium sp.]